MGDASQAKRFGHATTSVAHPAFEDHLEVDSEDTPAQERIAVIYSHDPAVNTPKGFSPDTVVCFSFEQLLLLLEGDRVDAILFDATVSHHEKAYITGWARIFRPTLTAHKLPTENVAN
ncbi:MAG: hypothetical protein FJY29_08480 [Betaproteobacteria bacterium]|nr:hypothetical protein [Betaproteobacteria bacterium]